MVPDTLNFMDKRWRIWGIVLNVVVAGLGFLFAPKGKRAPGWFWVVLWLVGNLVIPVVFAMKTNTFSMWWSVVVNIASAVHFSQIGKVKTYSDDYA